MSHAGSYRSAARFTTAANLALGIGCWVVSEKTGGRAHLYMLIAWALISFFLSLRLSSLHASIPEQERNDSHRTSLNLSYLLTVIAVLIAGAVLFLNAALSGVNLRH